jgi:hypothetical protein
MNCHFGYRTPCRYDYQKAIAKKEPEMVINLSPELEAALTEQARLQGMDPERLALNILRARFLVVPPVVPQDEWERRLFGAARDYGVSLSDWAVSSEGIYE